MKTAWKNDIRNCRNFLSISAWHLILILNLNHEVCVWCYSINCYFNQVF
jgi:hypothetical protein